MGIYGHSFDNLKVTNEGFKFLEKLKKRSFNMKNKITKPLTSKVPKYDIKKIEEKFRSDYKITPEVNNSGFDIWSVIKTKEDFDKVVKASKTSENFNDAKNIIFLTYCYTVDFPDDESYNITELIETIKKTPDREMRKEYKDFAIKMLEFANQNKLIIIELDTDSLFYCISDKNFYSIDFKGRGELMGTIEDMLDR